MLHPPHKLYQQLNKHYYYFELKQAEDSRRNGNGRMARNCIEDAILKQANRVLNSPDAKIDELIAEDFVLK